MVDFTLVGFVLCLLVAFVPSRSQLIERELKASDGSALSSFGQNVAVAGNSVLVGSSGKNSSQGAAYLFFCPPKLSSPCIQTQELVANHGQANDNFGVSVSLWLSGQFLVVGATGTQNQAGSIYIFACESPYYCSQISEFTPPDATADDNFGLSVCVKNSLIVVGANQQQVGSNFFQGAAYVYSCPTPFNCTLASKLVASDGGPFDQFGVIVAIDGNLIVVAAFRATVGSNSAQGAAYVFHCPTAFTCLQTSKLVASDGAPGDSFGSGLSVFGNMIAVGADQKTIGNNFYQGALYIYQCPTPSSCYQTQRILASDGAVYQQFGGAALIGSTLIATEAGAADPSDLTGSAYVFDCPTPSTCTQTFELFALNRSVGDYFGDSVAISNSLIVVGAYRKTIGANYQQGAVFAFSCPSPDTFGANCTSCSSCASGQCFTTGFGGYCLPLCFIGSDDKVHVRDAPSFVLCAEYTTNENDRGYPVDGNIDFPESTNANLTFVDFYFDVECTQYVPSSEIPCGQQFTF